MEKLILNLIFWRKLTLLNFFKSHNENENNAIFSDFTNMIISFQIIWSDTETAEGITTVSLFLRTVLPESPQSPPSFSHLWTSVSLRLQNIPWIVKQKYNLLISLFFFFQVTKLHSHCFQIRFIAFFFHILVPPVSNFRSIIS